MTVAESMQGDGAGCSLLERDGEIEAIDAALGRIGRTGSGEILMIEGPAGIGKSSLAQELVDRAEQRGFFACTSQGSEMERGFGFGVVRQLFGRALQSASTAERARLLDGAASLAERIFNAGAAGNAEERGGEDSLYGLYWLVANLAGEAPLLLLIDDAHWADVDSLRFARYLAPRLKQLPVLVVLAARPNEPGAEALAHFAEATRPPQISPGLLSEAATARIVEGRLGAPGPRRPPVCLSSGDGG